MALVLKKPPQTKQQKAVHASIRERERQQGKLPVKLPRPAAPLFPPMPSAFD